MAAPQNFLSTALNLQSADPVEEGYDLLDFPKIRQLTTKAVKEGLAKRFPISNDRHTLALTDIEADETPFSIKEQKQAIMEGRSLANKIKGRWTLTDNATGQTVAQTNKKIVMTLPWLTDRGTYIRNGHEYTLSHVMRLRPGVYARMKANGLAEAQVNVEQGTGMGMKIELDPATGTLQLRRAGKAVKLAGLLRAMGTTKDEMDQAWGKDLSDVNEKASQRDESKTHELFASDVPGLAKRAADESDALTKPPPPPGAPAMLTPAPDLKTRLREAFERSRLDPESTSVTLGEKHDRVTPKLLLAASSKLLRLARGEAEPDERDSLEFQRVYGHPDLFAERVMKDGGGVARKLLWKATNKGGLDFMPAGALNDHVDSLFNGSSLAQYIEGSSPMDMIDNATKVTRLGEGGLGDIRAAPASSGSRAVHNSYAGFIDPIRSPESLHVGLDAYLARGARKGSDGLLYNKFTNARTGKEEWVSSRRLALSKLAMPDQWGSKDAYMPVLAGAKGIDIVHRKDVDYVMRDPSDQFSYGASLVPMKSGIKDLRTNMGSKYSAQSLPLAEREAPFVSYGTADGKSIEETMGAHLGACKAKDSGVVESVSKDSIKVRYLNGDTEDVELYNAYPANAKGYMHNEPLVKPGDVFKKGAVLASSNYTDKEGRAALGRNLRTAWMSLRGLNFEDGIVITESAAKKLAHETLVKAVAPDDKETFTDPERYKGLFPGRFTAEQFKAIGKDGLAKPGTILQKGDPIILSFKENAPSVGTLGRKTHVDHAEVWDHDYPGMVLEGAHGKEAKKVLIKATVPVQQADKLCYSEDTEILTDTGWKVVSTIALTDKIASLGEDDTLEYLNPIKLHAYAHTGPMYSLSTTQVDLCVTPNHKLYARTGKTSAYELIRADNLYAKHYWLKNNCLRSGGADPEYMEIPGYEGRRGQGGRGIRQVPAMRMSPSDYAALLGMLLSEGNVFDGGDSGKGLEIHQTKPDSRQLMLRRLQAMGLHVVVSSDRFRVISRQLYEHFKGMGRSPDKRIPNHIFDWSEGTLKVLLYWLILGDGHTDRKGVQCYFSSSKGLIDDIQRLCLHVGIAARVECRRGEHIYNIQGKTGMGHAQYRAAIYNHKNEPEINHAHTKTQKGQNEQWADYSGRVYCVELPRNHVLYARRNGKACWSGNSNRFGSKGIISAIIPDSQAPMDSEGRPYEVFMSPLGILSRTNPTAMIETALGKVAEKTGRKYALSDFGGGHAADMAQKELASAGLSDTEDLVDPETGKTIPKIFTGNSFFYKLKHTVEGKESGRGEEGGYTSEETPGGKGYESAKRMGGLEQGALVAHGAWETIKDAKLLRGQANSAFWRDIKMGKTPAMPATPLTRDKFFNHLRGSGIHVQETPTDVSIFGMTGKQARDMAGAREVRSGATFDDKKFQPIKDGLFDPKIFGDDGRDWASIKLDEPIPNPVMEDTLRRVLNLGEGEYNDIAAGRKALGGLTGGHAIKAALDKVDLDFEINSARRAVDEGRGSRRDDAIKRLRALRALKEKGVEPKDFMMDVVPVLPPKFRPIMQNSGVTMAADANYLYKELIDARDDLAAAKGTVPDDMLADARARVYDSYKALTGLSEPQDAKLQGKGVKGLLKWVFGDSPKLGAQRRVFGGSVNMVGRGVIAPDPSLTIDQIGIPENQAWSIYEPFVVRELVAGGYPATDAVKMVANKTPAAYKALQKTVSSRPVLLNRAPSLHKFNMMGFEPILVKGGALRTNPNIISSMAGDYDGNCLDFDTPIFLSLSKSMLDIQYLQWYIELLKKGGVKMLTQDMNAVIEMAGNRMMLKIGEFPVCGEPVKDKNGADVYAVPPGVLVESYDPRRHMRVMSPVTRFTVEHDCDTREVTLQGALKVIASSNESMCVFDHETGGVRRATPDESVGFLCPVLRKGRCGSKGDHELGWWIGAFLSDGWISKTMIGYAKSEKAKRDEFVRLLRIYVDSNFSVREYTAKRGNDKLGDSVKLHISGPNLTKAVKNMDLSDENPREGRQALTKRVPNWIFECGSRELLLGILSGLIDGDGSMYCNMVTGKPRYMARLSTSSPALRDGFVRLLGMLGARASVTTTPPRGLSGESYNICVSQPDLVELLPELSFVGAREREMAARMLEAGCADTGHDRVPLTKAESAALSKVALKHKRMELYNAVRLRRDQKKVYSIGRPSIQAFLELADSALMAPILARATPNIRWSRVEDSKPAGRRDVFDLEVPDTKVFATADGLVVWDTCNFHVPISLRAAQEIREKMLPSRNLLSVRSFQAHYLPIREYGQGLYLASRVQPGKPTKTFESKESLKRAYQQGLVDVDEPVRLVENAKTS